MLLQTARARGDQMEIDLDKARDRVQDWCRTVGEYQRRFYRTSSYHFSSKSHPADLVTEVDRESESILIRHIEDFYPGTAILGEESGEHPSASDWLWVIDPLDGTVNYIHGIPVFCISVALQYKGESVLGVIYAPMLDEMYTAVKDGGAFCNGNKLVISSRTQLKDAVIGTGFSFGKNLTPSHNLAYCGRLFDQIRGIRRLGAAAYDLCLVAHGCLDGYWELNLKPWDVAAGTLIVTEAGGTVARFRSDHEISIVAGSTPLVQQLLREFKAADSAD